MNSALTQSGSEKATNEASLTDKPTLQFIKIDDGHILARVTRGNSVAEAIIHTVPPENSDDDETRPNTPAVSQDAP
jgi:hypothetical protein